MPQDFPAALPCLLASLALWRITHLLAEEDGPFDLVASLRARLGDTQLGRALDCFYCLSLWLALIPAAFLARTISTFLLLWFALSGAACLLQQATKEAAP